MGGEISIWNTQHEMLILVFRHPCQKWSSPVHSTHLLGDRYHPSHCLIECLTPHSHYLYTLPCPQGPWTESTLVSHQHNLHDDHTHWSRLTIGGRSQSTSMPWTSRIASSAWSTLFVFTTRPTFLVTLSWWNDIFLSRKAGWFDSE